jgi:hypothetical protein
MSRPNMDELDGSGKPLAAALLQEFQNFKDKFKNEDEAYEKGTPFPVDTYLYACQLTNLIFENTLLRRRTCTKKIH